MKTIVEVGANKGTDTQRFLADESARVFAFEPTPELCLELKNKFRNNERYFPVPMAVDLTDGWTWFNIAGQGDWGCSSIFDFTPNIHEIWEGRPDFKATDRCRVMTIRLDTFMRLYGVDWIDYLWIDAQGNDFRVLQSLGGMIGCVQAGQVETAYEVNLYSGVDNSTESVVKYLEIMGFKTRVVPHSHRKEADVYFER